MCVVPSETYLRTETENFFWNDDIFQDTYLTTTEQSVIYTSTLRRYSLIQTLSKLGRRRQ